MPEYKSLISILRQLDVPFRFVFLVVVTVARAELGSASAPFRLGAKTLKSSKL